MLVMNIMKRLMKMVIGDPRLITVAIMSLVKVILVRLKVVLVMRVRVLLRLIIMMNRAIKLFEEIKS